MGIYKQSSDSLRYRYRLKVYLGNSVVLFEDLNDDGKIEIEPELNIVQGTETEVIRRNTYYPFGMKMDGIWDNTGSFDLGTEYKYNGKEAVKHLYDYGARYYYPSIGRFTGVDQIAEDFSDVSVYNYAENSPIAHVDLLGVAGCKSRNSCRHPICRKDGRKYGTRI